MGDDVLQPEIITAKEAANLLRISYWTLVRRAKQGSIPGCFKIGGKGDWRFLKSELMSKKALGGDFAASLP